MASTAALTGLNEGSSRIGIQVANFDRIALLDVSNGIRDRSSNMKITGAKIFVGGPAKNYVILKIRACTALAVQR